MFLRPVLNVVVVEQNAGFCFVVTLLSTVGPVNLELLQVALEAPVVHVQIACPLHLSQS